MEICLETVVGEEVNGSSSWKRSGTLFIIGRVNKSGSEGGARLKSVKGSTRGKQAINIDPRCVRFKCDFALFVAAFGVNPPFHGS